MNDITRINATITELQDKLTGYEARGAAKAVTETQAVIDAYQALLYHLTNRA